MRLGWSRKLTREQTLGWIEKKQEEEERIL
jgi:hypothetical protein